MSKSTRNTKFAFTSLSKNSQKCQQLRLKTFSVHSLLLLKLDLRKIFYDQNLFNWLYKLYGPYANGRHVHAGGEINVESKQLDYFN